MSPDARTASSIPGTSFLRLVVCPPYAFARASETVPTSLPVAADTSRAVVRASCDVPTSPVARTSVPSAGRSSSSATAAALEVFVIQASVPLMLASEAPAFFRRASASRSAAAWSSAAALAACIPAAASPPRAAAAGTAALEMPLWNAPALSEVSPRALIASLASPRILSVRMADFPAMRLPPRLRLRLRRFCSLFEDVHNGHNCLFVFTKPGTRMRLCRNGNLTN
jgi:hypothetical protein